MPTLRTTLSDTVNELNKLLLASNDPAEIDSIRKLRRLYMALYDEVIEQQIQNNTPEFSQAIAELQAAEAACRDAVADLKKTAAAISKVVSAAKAVDKVIGLLASIATKV